MGSQRVGQNWSNLPYTLCGRNTVAEMLLFWFLKSYFKRFPRVNCLIHRQYVLVGGHFMNSFYFPLHSLRFIISIWGHGLVLGICPVGIVWEPSRSIFSKLHVSIHRWLVNPSNDCEQHIFREQDRIGCNGRNQAECCSLMLCFQLHTYVPTVQTVSLSVADGQKSLEAPVP